MYRFFTSHALNLKSEVFLDEEELHHLKKVLRVRPKEPIEIVNGQGQLGVALYDDSIYLQSLQTVDKPQKESILIQAITEKAHLELVMEKAVELGITAFWLFPSEKSKLKELSPSFLLRLKKITISAIKQSKRLFLPTIDIYHRLIDLKRPPFPIYLADIKGQPFTRHESSAAFIVGPESGLTEKEISFFLKTYNALPIKLSENVLRTETASIIASFLLS